MKSGSDFSVTFLGVGGSCALGSRQRSRYGANTSCVLVEAGGRAVILDMGTGLLHLGGRGKMDKAHILLSHYHLDHIEGMPFFDPFFDDGRFDIYGRPPEGANVRSVLSGLFQPPYLPITLADFRAEICYHDIIENFFVLDGGIEVSAIALDHPGGCTGYRIAFDGRSVVYLIDHERTGEDEIDFCAGADLVIYEAQFTAAEYASGRYKGWGHSHHDAGLALAEASGARRIVFVHHAIWRTDSELDVLAKQVCSRFKEAFIGDEEMRLEL